MPRSRFHVLASAVLVSAFADLGCSRGAPLDSLTFNEFEAVNDFVELHNASSRTIDLSGYRLADDTGMGEPRLDEAVSFPEGTQLEPNAVLLVIANLEDKAMPGRRAECGEGGPEWCFHARWGISREAGETFYVLDPAGEIAISQVYPPKAVGEGFSWGRLPDGAGGFGSTRPTPGHLNAPPWDAATLEKQRERERGTTIRVERDEDFEVSGAPDAAAAADPERAPDAGADSALGPDAAGEAFDGIPGGDPAAGEPLPAADTAPAPAPTAP